MLARLKARARALKTETYALYLAARHPRTPWYAKAWAAVVVAYAFSPIDLVPDFIPVLGYLDDLILIPLGIWAAVRLVPAEVLDECREQAKVQAGTGRPTGRGAAAVIVLVWLGLAALGIVLGLRLFQK